MLCDRCDRGCHIFCLSPPLETVPEGEWLCPTCNAPAADAFSFREGQALTLAEFERQAGEFRAKYFGGESKARKVSGEGV